MNAPYKPRLRYFEAASGQRHITGGDRYIYDQPVARHTVNVIGTGTIGQEHMRVASMLGRVRVHGIYDEAPESVAVAREEFASHASHDLVVHESLESACEDPDVDALIVCTPNHTHVDVLEVAARSGKPILLEKPMATTLAGAKRILDIATGYPSFIQVGLQYRYKAPYVEARHEVIDRASVGSVKMLSMSEYRPPFLDKVGQWNKFNQFSGGTLVEKCCHYFDLLNLLAAAPPKRVFATSGQAVAFTDFNYDEQQSDIDDHALVVIEYANEVRAQFALNMFSPHFYEELVVCGDKGRVVANERFDFLRDEVARSSVTIERDETAPSRKAQVGYARLIEQSGHHGATYFEHVAFADQLDGKPTDCATAEQGYWSIAVAAAAQASSDQGVCIDMDSFLKQQQGAQK
ncbi:MAG: Gfo/Idh/MocA family oxidoreductase [Pseudomonadota bacterium]